MVFQKQLLQRLHPTLWRKKFHKGPLSRMNSVKAVMDCYESRLGLKISASDIITGYGMPVPKKGPRRPIVVCFASRSTREKVFDSRSLLRKQQWDAKIYINEHLTKLNSETFANGRRLLKDRKISSVWISNGYIYLKKSEVDKPSRIFTLENLNRQC